MKISLGFSTCPNDTFIFDALVNSKVDTEGLEFEPFIADVEELNLRAFDGNIDLTKLSFHAFAYLADTYQLLNSGSALGYKNGPLLVSKRKLYLDEVNSVKIAIPGKYTTANLLFSIVWPQAKQKTEYIFSDIEDAILDGQMDAGLLIHENRFTYEKKGLLKVSDLGEYWANLTNKPIPLGGIAVNRKLPDDVALKIDRSLKRSVEFALNKPNSSFNYVSKYATNLDKEVIMKHINLYVNNFTIDIGVDGKEAVMQLYSKARSLSIIPKIRNDLFVS